MDNKVIDLINLAYPNMTIKEKEAFFIAFGAHEGQKQKDYAGLEYIAHPLIIYLGCNNEDERIVALLHDVIEDTKITIADLELFFDKKIIDALKLITHEKIYDRDEYIKKIKENPIARRVKILDLKTNLDETRFDDLIKWHKEKSKKYIKDLKYLEED